MNRDELDAWFAQADDVLDNWHGGTDAMHARVPTTDDAEALPGDSYYDQAWTTIRPIPRLSYRFDPDALARMTRSMEQFQEAFRKLAQSVRESAPAVSALRQLRDELERNTTPTDHPRDRALNARRNRNTGPANHIGLDGRRHARPLA